MKISVTLKPNSKTESIEENNDGSLTIKVRAPAKEGKANSALIAAISDYLGIPKSRVAIASGHTSRKKIISVI